MKTKRKMPAHIVLPNGMWRFVKSGSKKAKAAITRTRKVKVKRRVLHMVRRKHSKKSSGGFGLGGGMLSKGLFRPKGMVAAALLGIGAAAAVRTAGLHAHPMQDEAIGFVCSGIVGAGANYLLKNSGNLLGGITGNASASGVNMY